MRKTGRIALALPELELVIDEVDASIGKQRLQHVVDLVRQRLHLRDFGDARSPENTDVVLIAERRRIGISITRT